jgi:Domain of unknown function (DUF3850)
VTEHELKCWPRFFREVASGMKTVEVRLNDRGFKPYDALTLREWDPETKDYTGAVATCLVTELHALDDLGPPFRGWVAMRIGLVRR